MKIIAILTSFRFMKSAENNTFIIGSFLSDDKPYQGIVGNSGDIPFETLLRAKSLGIPFHLVEDGTFTDKQGKTHPRFLVSIGTL